MRTTYIAPARSADFTARYAFSRDLALAQLGTNSASLFQLLSEHGLPANEEVLNAICRRPYTGRSWAILCELGVRMGTPLDFPGLVVHQRL